MVKSLRVYGNIDHVNKIRSCNSCKQVKPFSDFSPVGGKRTQPAHRCKKCRSTAASNREMERRLEANPDLYSDCDNCDKIFKKVRSRNGVAKYELSNCPYCKKPI